MADGFSIEFNFDEEGLERAMKAAAEPHLRDTAVKMEKVLSDLVAQHAGQATDDIKPALQAAFLKEDWSITDPELSRYAEAISAGTKIRVEVDMR